MTKEDRVRAESFVRALQTYYPMIYLACHDDHVRARSTPYRLSARDSSLLAHLDETHPTPAAKLAAHLGVAASTLSGAVARLEAHGYLERRKRAGDRRRVDLFLTRPGARAMSATSVLDARRLKRLFGRLTDAERKAAVRGLRLLARASSEAMRGDHRPKKGANG